MTPGIYLQIRRFTKRKRKKT